MPFPTHQVLEIPRKELWGEPKGRVRHIHIEASGTHAIYVLEQAPGYVPLKIHHGRWSWEHQVFVPWRYFFIRVNANSRVDSHSAGYLYYSTRRAESLEDVTIFPGTFPNVFGSGGMCLGYTMFLRDRSPVRVAWRAARSLYDKIGNQWMSDDLPGCVGRGKLDTKNHLDHDLWSHRDPSCKWSDASPILEKDLSLWDVRYTKLSILGVVSCLQFPYQGHNEWTDERIAIHRRIHGFSKEE